MTVNWKRPEKGKARSFMMTSEDISYYNEMAKLFMPAGHCHDIKEGLKNKTLKRSDFIIAIDNDEKVCKKIRRFLKKNFDNFIVICSMVQNVNLAEVLEGKKIDFAFLDLCGELKGDIFHWLYKSRDCFTDTCRFGLTVIAFNRVSKFEPVIHKEVSNTEYVEYLEYLLEESKNNLTKKMIGDKIEVKNPRQAVRKTEAIRAVNVIKSIKASCYSFMIAMNNKDISIKRLYRYKDKGHSEMVFIDFRFNGKKDGDDFTMHIVREFDKKVGEMSQILSYPKTKKQVKKSGIIIANNANDIIKALSLEALPLTAGKKAWISKLSNKAGKDPVRMNKKIEKILSNVA